MPPRPMPALAGNNYPMTGPQMRKQRLEKVFIELAVALVLSRHRHLEEDLLWPLVHSSTF